jgi:hypothetical protein
MRASTNSKNDRNDRSDKSDRRTYATPRNYTALGRYLQEMRHKAGLTQREVSIALGYSSAQFISNFEAGIASPPLAKLKQLVEMYKMPIEKLMALVLEGEKAVLMSVLRPTSGYKTRFKRL